MTKDDKKFVKRLRHQIDDLTAETRYTLDAKTGTITPVETGKKHKDKKTPEDADGK